jgi:hypothetical protein
MSIGIFLSYANFLLLFYDGTKAKCIAEDVIFHIAFSITFGSLIIKTWVLQQVPLTCVEIKQDIQFKC